MSDAARSYALMLVLAIWGAGVTLGTERWGIGWLGFTLVMSAVCFALGRWIRDAD